MVMLISTEVIKAYHYFYYALHFSFILLCLVKDEWKYSLYLWLFEIDTQIWFLMMGIFI